MMKLRHSSLFLLGSLCLAGLLGVISPFWVGQSWASRAFAQEPIPIMESLTSYEYQISTQSDTAQQYFNQGLLLAYGFNHAEAARSFKAAIAADSSCAACYWGLAYVLGPNINAPMAPEAVSSAWEAIQQAIALNANASPREQALIQATATRYEAHPEGDRATLDLAYATALGEVHRQYPEDLDIATLYAEALMDTMPWDYWDEQGNPRPNTLAILQTLELVLEKNPNHIGAQHLYIHAVEKERPDLAVSVADRLQAINPQVGHLIHMPSHIYIRVGRYHDSVVANQAAIATDDAYVQSNHVPSLYTVAYMPHNHHFLWFSALMTGQSALAIQAADHTADVDPEQMRSHDFAAGLQHYYTMPLFTRVRFEQWADIQTLPPPAEDLKYPTGVWRYAQGMAATATGDLDAATQDLTAITVLAQDPDLADLQIWGFNGADRVLRIAAAVLAGEIALAQENYASAVTYLQSAIELEDQLVYTEPPDWYSPTRNLLGQALLQAGHYQEAEQAFGADLEVYPENGWSLHGLAQSLEAQDKLTEAALAQARFEQAWQYADISL